jgi:YYY domain-containing protein
LGKLSQSSFQSAIPGLQTVVLAFNGLTQVLGGQMLAPYNYWDPTRVIPATINEFPYFSFLFADLHPHMIGLPFTVLFLALAFNWLASERTTNSEWRLANGRERKVENEGPNGTSPLPISNLSFTYSLTRSLTDSFTRSFAFSLIRSFARFLALPFVLGAIAIINTWDLPTYLGLMAAVFLLGRYRREPGSLTLGRAGLLLVSTLIFTVALLAVTYLLYAPFFANYQAIDVGLGLVYTQTALDQHLKIWGFFLFIIASWLGFMLLYPNTRHGLLRALSLALRRWNVLPHLSEIYKKLVKPSDSIQLALWGLGLVLVIALGLWLLGYRVPAYLLPLVSLALLLLIRRETGADTAYLNLLAFTGLLVLLGVEFFFLRDFLGGGEYYRMNTLFKFYIQVWVMFGLTAAVITPRLWLASEGWVWLRWPWRIAFTILLLATLIYPVLGTRTRLDDRFPGDQNRPPIGTLDGLAYMTVGVFEWPAGSPISLKHDYEAIRWLQDNVFGTPIIAEAKVGFYREGGMRVAAYTGLPSILGGLHQSEQRYAWQVGDRDFLVSEFWSSPDPARTLQLLDQLGVTYVYIGQIERITHGNFVADKFEQLRAQGALELVFENEQTKIYKRLRSSQ